jgi:hypothetical protein
VAENGQPYAYTDDDPTNDVDPSGDASSSLAFATQTYDQYLPKGLGGGSYTSVLTPQGINHVQVKVLQLESTITKLYGYDPGYNVIWFFFKEATAATLIWPTNIAFQRAKGTLLYQSPFTFYNSAHGSTTVQWFVAVGAESDRIATSYFSPRKSKITPRSAVTSCGPVSTTTTV